MATTKRASSLSITALKHEEWKVSLRSSLSSFDTSLLANFSPFLTTHDNQQKLPKEGAEGGEDQEPEPHTLTKDNPDLHLYASIPSFSDYTDLTNSSHYIRIPPTWHVIVSDIEGSTGYIESGRYRDVNTVGASCIAVVRNALLEQFGRDTEFAYVFGGDGASFVLPESQLAPAIEALMAWRRLVRANYGGMSLRVGSVSVKELQEGGACVDVARYEVVSGMCIAMFRGGGLGLADRVVKAEGGIQDEEYYKTKKPTAPNLDGISCRWQKIPNAKGCVLSLLVMDNEDQPESEVYDKIMEELDDILDLDSSLVEANPVNVGLATYKTIEEMLAEEVRMHERRWSASFFQRSAEIHLCYAIFYLHQLQNTPLIDAPAYKQGMRTHSDYRKFDDMVRMVLDCTLEQADAIDKMLQQYHQDGHQIFYGTHRSPNTLMTCLVGDTSEGQHIHFIDGDNGGYAMAAKTLKLQLGKYAMTKRGRSLRNLKKGGAAA